MNTYWDIGVTRRIVVLVVLTLALTGCNQAARPNVPKEVLVGIEQDKVAPEWAKKALYKPVRKSDRIDDHLAHEDALDGFVDLLLCQRSLLVRLMAGEKVADSECTPQP